MQDPISLSIGRCYLEVPKNVSPIDMLGYTIYFNVVNGKKYKYEQEYTVGQKLRIPFDCDRKRLKYVTYDEYLEFRDKELDGRNIN